jgi:hypothetical protein
MKVQGVGVLHVPWMQVCLARPAHCVVPGVHAPATHAPVAAEQTPHTAPSFIHCALRLQSCGWFPLHCLAFGMHSPVQAPFVQRYGHAWVSFHAPSALQVCAVVPLHRFEPGMHTPQPVSEQPNVQASPLSQAPSIPHVKNLLESHLVPPGRHSPTQAPFEQRAGQAVSNLKAPSAQMKRSNSWQTFDPAAQAPSGGGGGPVSRGPASGEAPPLPPMPPAPDGVPESALYSLKSPRMPAQAVRPGPTAMARRQRAARLRRKSPRTRLAGALGALPFPPKSIRSIEKYPRRRWNVLMARYTPTTVGRRLFKCHVVRARSRLPDEWSTLAWRHRRRPPRGTTASGPETPLTGPILSPRRSSNGPLHRGVGVLPLHRFAPGLQRLCSCP